MGQSGAYETLRRLNHTVLLLTSAGIRTVPFLVILAAPATPSMEPLYGGCSVNHLRLLHMPPPAHVSTSQISRLEDAAATILGPRVSAGTAEAGAAEAG